MFHIKEKMLGEFEIRKTKKQKSAFRAWLRGTLEDAGFCVTTEKGNFSTNMIAGDPDTAKILLTAHYDTCPVLPFPNFITPRNIFFYLIYQVLICLPIFLIAIGGEVALLMLWEDCPLWAAMATVYILMGFMVWWIMDGPANKHTANDNTSGVLTLLEIAYALPADQKHKVAFVFFDNEEKGLFGSSSFAGRHKAVKKNTLVLNFDCVSDGDHIHFFPSGKAMKDTDAMDAIRNAFPSVGYKTFTLMRGFYPSDQKCFAKGVGVCALKHHRILGYYMDRIHTGKDTVLDERNISLLCDGTVRLVKSLPQ